MEPDTFSQRIIMPKYNQPMSGLVTPRFGGVATFNRLPHVPLDDAVGIDIGIVGIPWDGGTTNRPGPRHAPRQMRDQSSMVRRMHQVTRIVPYDLANIADLGDCPVNPANVDDALKRVETYFKKLVGKGIRPLSAGGDHLCSLPVLRAVGSKKPVGMIHFDAHTDLYDSYFGGFKYTHGTPFRRAIEEGVLDPKRTIQIGLRGSMYDNDDFEYGEKMGVRLVRIEEAIEKGPKAIMAEARKIVGDQETYVSFDIDMLDPVYAPGTGTPEIGGFTTREAQAMLRELRGLNIVGADVVEVSPPFDPSGLTAYAGVVMMFEIMCHMAENVAKGRK
jgi:guanidinopropionase